MSKELEKLLAMAKTVKMTPGEQEKQRRSFAYGNARIENDQITWEKINKAADSIPKPNNGRGSIHWDRACSGSREEKVQLEARNVVMQYDYIVRLVQDSDSRFSLTIPIILELHRLAIQDVYACAGKFRLGGIAITNTPHKPPEPEKVQEFCEQMCSYVRSNWNRSPIHLAAYLMWRHNWIHPFNGGNGRTSRAVSYLVLCTKLGYVLPGTPTIPQQIVGRRDLYYAALRAAADDALVTTGSPDVRAMEQLLADMLAKQLYELHSRALADDPPGPSP